MCIRKICLATTSAMALSISPGAMAQSSVPAATVASEPTADRRTASADQGTQIEEIVVTANRRSEPAQSVPISVAEFSEDQALGRGVTDTVSLANAVPGLRVDRSPGSVNVFLRGVGTATSTAGAEPSVSLYVDDVYIPAGAAFFANYNNIDRVEVLKGPQGTLFGRNATGGVIQVFTRDPSSSPSLDVSAGYANYDTVNGSMYASGGLADGLSANISVYGGNQGQGWGKNLTTGKDAFKTNWNYGGRIKLLFEPGSDTRVLLTADHDTTASSQGYNRAATGTVAYGFIPGPTGFYDAVDSIDAVFKSAQSGISAKIAHDMSWATLVNVTAYRHLEQSTGNTLGGAPIPIIVGNFRIPENTFTQELRLQSPDASRIRWVGGFYYMRDQAAYDPLELSGMAFGPVTLQSVTRSRTASYAGFGQAMVPIAQDTHLTLGLRDTSDDRKLESSWAILPTPAAGPSPNSPQSKVFNKLTWRMSLDHQFTPDIMSYASYNRGFKSGGYNLVILATAPIAPPVNPEVLDAFAIGEKTEFLDHRLQINSEAFYYKYRDIQVFTIVTGGTIASNAASASIKGIDVDVKAIPVRNLTLTASLEYLHAVFDRFPNGVLNIYSPGCSPGSSMCSVVADLSGFKLPYAAPFSASLAANYLYPTSIGNFNFNVAYNHGGNYYFDQDDGIRQLNPSLDKQGTLNLVNASLGWSSKNRKYDATLWGRNITGQKYLSIAAESSVGMLVGPAAPATYGVTFVAHLF